MKISIAAERLPEQRVTDSLQRVNEVKIQRQKGLLLIEKCKNWEKLKEKLDNTNEPSAYIIPIGLPGLNTYM
jgi:hypothetical protein